MPKPCPFNLITGHFHNALDALTEAAEKKIFHLSERKEKIVAARAAFKVIIDVRVLERESSGSGGFLWRSKESTVSGRITNADSLLALIEKAAREFHKKYPDYKEATFEIDLVPSFDGSCSIPYDVGRKLNRKVSGLALSYKDPTPRYA